MNDYHQFRDKIRELVSRWKKEIKPGIEEQGQYGETNTRKYIIDPVLEALNWVDDGSKKTVDNEFAVKHKTGTGSADYALKVNGIPKILLEAKDVAKVKDLDNGYDTVHGIKRTYPRQLSNYCHDLNSMNFDIGFSILTNGKEWIVYNMQYADISSEREIVFRLDIEEMDSADNLQKLWSLELNQFIDGHRLRELIQQLHDYRLDIDKKAVQQLLECKDLLSTSILNDYEKDKRGIKKHIDKILEDKEKTNGMPTFKEIPEEVRLNFFIKESSSSVINKILFIRILEDKNFLTPKLTKRSIEKWKDFMGYKDYEEIMKLFRDACGVTEKLYNGGLFKLNPYDKISYDHNIIKKIIDILGDIKFREIDSDIIGRIYEIYLGQVLKVEAEIRGKKRTKYQADNKERKKLGQYYTPKFVVDFIVKNTLGKLMEGKKPEEIAKIRILDPACGSGSFLINAYDKLVEYYENWNSAILKKIEEDNKKNGASLDKYQNNGAIPNYKNIVLKDNIHGVDLNDLSVQISEINLWLRALERDKKLIKLNKNILHGNSLITGVEDEKELTKYQKELEEIKERTHEIKDYYDKDELDSSEKKKLEKLEDELKKLKKKINPELNENLKTYFDDHLNTVHPFNWEVEFPEVMQEGGFDVVIGNPPYVAWNKIMDRELFECKEFLGMNYSCRPNHADAQPNLYLFFLVRSQLVAKKGIVSLIIPQEWLFHNYAQDFRDYFAKNSGEIRIVQFNPNFKVFRNPSEIIGTNSLILFLDNSKKTGKLIWHYIEEMDEENIIDILSNDIKLKEGSLIKEFNLKEIIGLPWTLTSKNIETIKSKIELNKGIINLDDTSYFDVKGGFQPPINVIKTFEISNSERSYLTNKELEFCHNVVYDASDMRRYFIRNKHKKYWITLNDFSDEKVLAKTSPNLYKILSKRIGKKRGMWWHFPNIRNYELIKKYPIKILSPRTAEWNSFSVDDDKSVFKGTNTMIISKKLDSFYVVGILNSLLSNFWYSNFGYDYHGGKSKKYEPDKTKNYSIPIIECENDKQKKIEISIINNVKKIMIIINGIRSIYLSFRKSLSNKPIPEPKACKFGHYFDNYELYNMDRETSAKINQIKAKILSLNITEEGDKLVIYMTNYNEEQNQIWENVKAVKLTIKDEDIRKFLFFALKQYINEKGGRGFGKGNLLELIKNIGVPVYIQNVKMNIGKIKEVMKEFNHLTKDLWFKDGSKKERFKSLNGLDVEIKKTNREIDDMVYKLYGITEDEKKIIEGSLNQ
jgi:adenine-specific DNA-methyltransferase